MREIYLLTLGVVLGVMARDLLENFERRIAYRAADQAADTLDLRKRWPPRGDPEPEPAPAATVETPAAAT